MEIPEGIYSALNILNIIKFASNFDLHVVMAQISVDCLPDR